MWQKALQLSGGGGGININPQTPSELNNDFTKKRTQNYVEIEGFFYVSTYRNSPIFLTGLPKPKAEISNGGNISTTGVSTSITITTNGEAKINNYNGFSTGITFTYSIKYPIEE